MQYFWVNQKQYKKEREAQYLRAFVNNIRPHVSRTAIQHMEEGDICFSITKDGLVSVNSICGNVREISTTAEGRVFEISCSYSPLKEPISLNRLLNIFDNFPIANSRFDKNERRIMGYIFPLPDEIGQEIFKLAKAKSVEHAQTEQGVNFEDRITKSFNDSQKNRLARLSIAKTKPQKILVTTAFQRNPDVVAEVLFQAAQLGWLCSNCKAPAPFNRKNGGLPYLEVHHIKPLADGGDDTVENAVALCPTCHRKFHFGA